MSRTNPILAVPLIVHAGCPGNTVRQDEGALDPAVAMWTPNIVIGLIGLFLTLQAAEIIRRPVRRRRRVTAANRMSEA